MSIHLKKINYEDIDKEYKAIKSIPKEENGVINKYRKISKAEFKNNVIPNLLDHSNGINLEPNHVPDTYFFLWDDDTIVGLFKIRHYLNDALRSGAGHIAYTILKKYRGRGYATEGLKAAVKLCNGFIKEDEIYLSCNKNNKKWRWWGVVEKY